jgi:NADH dehydrogenase [ubiquinone] 1 alpha subcomplex assembly factor 7
MNALKDLIREMIIEAGPISVETYMTLALSHPVHGYYRTRVPFGAKGDFVTAPEISQMFGELIGLWSIAVWQTMGAPSPVRLVELGPGRGSLIADALRAARVAPGFLAALDLHLVETSEILRNAQAYALKHSQIAAKWHESIEDLPPGPAITIANEFFDCLPVRHYVRAQDGWCERVIGLDDQGNLTFGLAPAPEPDLTLKGELGETREIGLAAARLVHKLAERVARQGGVLLVIDYGYARPGRGETLQALRCHQYVDPLQAPGEADLTAHVDFAALAQAARAAGAAVEGPVPQGEWLKRLGIFERAAVLRRHGDTRQQADLDAALARLTGYRAEEMGIASMAELFKVLAVKQSGLPLLPGFSPADT